MGKLTVVTSFAVLMRLAYDVGQAKREKDPEKLKQAKERLAAYEQLCKDADQVSLGVTNENL